MPIHPMSPTRPGTCWNTSASPNGPLGDAEVFQQVPGRVGDMGWIGIHLGAGKGCDRLVEGHVGMTTAQLCEQLLTQHLIRAHLVSSTLVVHQGAHQFLPSASTSSATEEGWTGLGQSVGVNERLRYPIRLSRRSILTER